MFTGIVQRLGRVLSMQEAAGGARLTIDAGGGFEGLAEGESVAVEGACLTVEPGSAPERMNFFLSDETLAKTTLGALKAGRRVNLERSLAVGDRMGGHFVMGHVDAVGRIARLDRRGEGWDFEVEFPPELRRYLAPKGSVSVDGISLTTVEIRPSSFTVAVIPHTREVTSLRDKGAGSPVNLEADVIARYVAERLAAASPSGGASENLLRQAGFLKS